MREASEGGKPRKAFKAQQQKSVELSKQLCGPGKQYERADDNAGGRAIRGGRSQTSPRVALAAWSD